MERAVKKDLENVLQIVVKSFEKNQETKAHVEEEFEGIYINMATEKVGQRTASKTGIDKSANDETVNFDKPIDAVPLRKMDLD